MSGKRQELGNSFISDKKAGRDLCPFSEPSAHRATEPQSQQVGAISETPSIYLTLPHPGDPLGLHPTQFTVTPKLLTVTFPY